MAHDAGRQSARATGGELANTTQSNAFNRRSERRISSVGNDCIRQDCACRHRRRSTAQHGNPPIRSVAPLNPRWPGFGPSRAAYSDQHCALAARGEIAGNSGGSRRKVGIDAPVTLICVSPKVGAWPDSKSDSDALLATSDRHPNRCP